MRKAVVHKSSIPKNCVKQKLFESPEFLKEQVGFLPIDHEDFLFFQTVLIAYRIDPELGRQYQIMKLASTGEYAIGKGVVITEDMIHEVTSTENGDEWTMGDIISVELTNHARKLTNKDDFASIFKDGEDQLCIQVGNGRVYVSTVCECAGHDESKDTIESCWVTKSELEQIIEDGKGTTYLNVVVPYLPW